MPRPKAEKRPTLAARVKELEWYREHDRDDFGNLKAKVNELKTPVSVYANLADDLGDRVNAMCTYAYALDRRLKALEALEDSGFKALLERVKTVENDAHRIAWLDARVRALEQPWWRRCLAWVTA